MGDAKKSNHAGRWIAACALVAFGLLCPATGHADVEPPAGCKAATLTGESRVDPATGAFVGAGNLGLDHAIAVQWVSVISSFVVNADGTLAITSSHHITSTTGDSIDVTTADSI